MPLTDISRVTTAITTLLQQLIDTRDSPVEDVVVSSAPADDNMMAGEAVVNVHLFHLIEDPHHKNLPPVVRGAAVPTRFNPMALVLNYVITVRNTAAVDVAAQALSEQRLLGYVARSLHDFPVVDHATQVGPNPSVFATAGIDDETTRLELMLRPVGIDELVNFWSAEQSHTPRPSLFFEARVVLLDIPPPPPPPGIVLSLGTFVFAGGPPHLLRTRNVLALRPPTPGLSVEPLRLSSDPARVAVFPAGAVPPGVAASNSRLLVEGSGFQPTGTSLELKGPVIIDGGPLEDARFALDLNSTTINAAWELDHDGTRIQASVRTQVTDAQGRNVELFPGIYQVRVLVTLQPPSDTTGNALEFKSNQLFFAVIPQVSSVVPGPGPMNARPYTLTLHGNVLHDDLDVELIVGGVALQRSAAPGPGEFDFTSGTNVVDFVVDTTQLTSPAPVRLAVEGADATPSWLEF